ESIPAAAVKAWEGLGAHASWMRLGDDGALGFVYFNDDSEALPGDLPSFKFFKWTDAKLEGPGVPFGLSLDRLDVRAHAGLRHVGGLKNLRRLGLGQS